MEAEDHSMKALAVVVVEEVAELQRLVALVEGVVAGQVKRLGGGVVGEEDHLLQAAVARVSRRLVGEVEEQGGQSSHLVLGLEVEVAAAFLQLQHSRLGRKNLLEVVVEDHLSVQVEEAVPKRCACPRKVAVR